MLLCIYVVLLVYVHVETLWSQRTSFSLDFSHTRSWHRACNKNRIIYLFIYFLHLALELQQRNKIFTDIVDFLAQHFDNVHFVCDT